MILKREDKKLLRPMHFIKAAAICVKAVVWLFLHYPISHQEKNPINKFLLWLSNAPQRRKTCMRDVKRVLVVRLDEIGDVVLTTPFLRELRQNLPLSCITFVVKPEVYNLVEFCPYVDEVLTFNRIFRTAISLKNYLPIIKFAVFRLIRRDFDLAILPRWDVDLYHASFLIYCSGAKIRIGYSEHVNANKEQQNRGYDLLFTHVSTDKTLKHEAERGLGIFKLVKEKTYNNSRPEL